MKKFWMVYVCGQRGPAYTHDTYESAQREAARLAGKLKIPTYVLEAVTVARCSEVTVTKLENGESIN